MKRWLELSLFLTLAAALHLAAFAAQPRSGITAGGSGGDAMVSLKAAAPTVAEMVRAWEQPRPTITQPIPLSMQQPYISKAPAMPDVQLEQAPRAQVNVALMTPQDEAPPQIDTAPPPPPEQSAKSDDKPKNRPDSTPKPEGRKAKVTSAGVAKQVSAGSGGGAHAGSGAASVTTGSPGKQAKLQAVWGAKIRARIERNKRYPRAAESGGDVKVQLTVSRDGKLLSYALAGSSGHSVLDQAALKAVARAKRFHKAPKELQNSSYRFSVVIRLMPRG